MGSPVTWIGSEATTALRNTVGDPDSSATQRWTDAEMRRYLDRGGQQVVLRTEHILETTWTIEMVNAQDEYELPDNFIADKHVEWVKTPTDIRRLTYLTHEEFHRSGMGRDPTLAGDPLYYWFWKKLGDDPVVIQPSSIHVYPVKATVDADSGDDVLRIYGWKIADAVAATDVLEVDGPYIEAVIFWAAMLIYLDDGDGPMADRMESRFERQVRAILDYSSHKSRSERSRIKPRWSPLHPWPRSPGPVLPWERGFS